MDYMQHDISGFDLAGTVACGGEARIRSVFCPIHFDKEVVDTSSQSVALKVGVTLDKTCRDVTHTCSACMLDEPLSPLM